MHSISLPLSASFMSPHFCFLVVLFAVSLLIVVMCEVVSTMGKGSSKPKVPLYLFLSHFQDFKDAAVIFAMHVKPG